LIFLNLCEESLSRQSQDPALPSSQGSSRLSIRECSAVVLKSQASIPSTCMGLPQHSGILDSPVSCAILLPQFTHSKFTFSAMNSSLDMSVIKFLFKIRDCGPYVKHDRLPPKSKWTRSPHLRFSLTALPFSTFQSSSPVLIVDLVHETDNSLTTKRYFVILYLLDIAQLANGLQMNPDAPMK
jgi:hypothetical protein